MVPADAVVRLRMIRTGSICPITYRQLVARFGSAKAALAALPDLARRGGRASPGSLLSQILFPEPDFQQSAQASPFDDNAQ